MKKMKMLKGLLLLIFGGGFLFYSCQRDNSEELKAKEKTQLTNYLLAHNITTAPTSSGLYYIKEQDGTGAQPTEEGAVAFDYTMRLINDDVVMSTIKDTAAKYELSTSSVYFAPIKYRPIWLIPGLKEGLLLMHEGEVATLIIPSSLAWKGSGNVSMGVDPYTTVIYQISLRGVATDGLAWEHEAITAYLDTVPKAKIADSTSTGVIHIIDKVSTGNIIEDGNSVSFRYKGYFINGYKFQEISSTDNLYSLFVGSGDVLTGISEGLQLMRKGEVGRLIIPYKQAYDEMLTVPGIPPFSTLVFEISDLE